MARSVYQWIAAHPKIASAFQCFCRDARNHRIFRKALCNDGTRANHATVAQFHILQDHGLGTNPAPVPNFDAPLPHWERLRINALSEFMITVCDVDIGAEQILITDFDNAACINHQMPIEVVMVTDPYADVVTVGVLRPQPTALRESVIASDLDLAKSATTPAAFHSVTDALAHSKHPVGGQANSTRQSSGDPQKECFNVQCASAPSIGFPEMT
jgi:hypothetical protein